MANQNNLSAVVPELPGPEVTKPVMKAYAQSLHREACRPDSEGRCEGHDVDEKIVPDELWG